MSPKYINLQKNFILLLTISVFFVEPLHVMATDPIVINQNSSIMRQALLQQTNNGIPLINITAPTVGGVSRNDYTIFNVPQTGVILNNNYTTSNTKLAGYIPGNTNMMQGSAKIIVNEVTGANSTSINGFLEVAGNKASVVVANPNGIIVNGGGFINTTNAILTTGKTNYNTQGNLNYFDVINGNICIEGTGLDAKQAESLAIISKATTINAGIFANTLDIRTGINTVDANTLETKFTNSRESNKEGVALDISSIGGMYANRITMIGTELGFGINNKGTLQSAQENMILESNGNLINIGHVISKKKAQIQNIDILNQGIIESQNELLLNGRSLNNTGQIHTNQDSTIQINQDITQSGEILAGKSLDLQVQRTLINHGNIVSNDNTNIQSNAIENSKNGSIIGTNTSIKANQSLINEGLINGIHTTISGLNITNQNAGRIYGNKVSIQSDTLKNQGIYSMSPVIAARQSLGIGANQIINTEHAKLQSAGNLHIGQTVQESSSDDSVTTIGITSSIINCSATIAADDSITIMANILQNQNNHFSTKSQLVNTKSIQEVAGNRDGDRYTLTDDKLHPYSDQKNNALGIDAVFAYEDESDHLYIKGTTYEDWWKFNYVRKTYDDVVIQTDPGIIRAGKNITITGNILVNDKSSIVAGDTLSTRINHMKQIEAAGTRKYIDEGTVTAYSRHHRHGIDSTNIDTSTYHGLTSQKIIIPITEVGSHRMIDTHSNVIENFSPIVSITTPTGKVITSIPSSHIVANSLFIEAPSTATYYIETDPAYTNKKKFLSSDYMIQQLVNDPQRLMKRLGDGNYEMQLVQDQILHLTGKQYLDGTHSTEDEYQTLMDQAISFSQLHNVRIGIGLTPEQQAELTESIVWFVETSVMLPSGEIVKALVPEVYVVDKNNNSATSHISLISANIIDMQASKEILNTGTILARDTATLSSKNININHGTIQGTNINLLATDSIHSLGSTIAAQKEVNLQAHNDITFTSSTQSYESESGNITNIDRINLIHSQDSNNQIIIQAGHDISVQGSLIDGAGYTKIQAGNSINLNTVNTSSREKIVSNSKNTRLESHSKDIGSILTGVQGVSLDAAKNVTIRSATIASNKKIYIKAGKNIMMSSAKQTVGLVEDHEHKGKTGGGHSQTNTSHDEMYKESLNSTSIIGNQIDLKSGQDTIIKNTSIVAGQKISITGQHDVTISGEIAHTNKSSVAHKISNGFLSSEKSTDTYTHKKDSVQSSDISGNTISIKAGNDTNISASKIVSKTDTTIKVGSDANFSTMKNVQNHTNFSQVKRTGFSTAKFGITYGSSKEISTNHEHMETTIGTTIASLNGITHVTAGKSLTAKKTTIQGEKSVNLKSKSIDVVGDAVTYEKHNKYDKKQTGLTVSLGGNIINSVIQANLFVNQSADRQDKRLTSLEILEAHDQVKNALKDIHTYTDLTKSIQSANQIFTKSLNNILNSDGSVNYTEINNAAAASNAKQKAQSQKDALVNISLNIGSSHQSISSDVQQSMYQGSSVKSQHGNVIIVATGQESESGYIKATGVSIEGQNIILKANKDIILNAGESKSSQKSNNHSNTWSIGTSFGLNTGILSSINIEDQISKEQKNIDTLTHVNTHVIAHNIANIQTNHDIQLKGTKISGKNINMSIGNDFTVTSLQDTNIYHDKTNSAGISVNIPMLGEIDVNGNANKGTINSNYASVTEQSGIYAGNKGFHIQVGNNTTLTGAVIASNASKDDNHFITHSLTMNDIANTVDYSASSKGVTYNDFSGFGSLSKTKKNQIYNQLGILPKLSGDIKEDGSSTTYSAIADGYLKIKDGSMNPEKIQKDTEHSLNQLSQIFDKVKIKERQKLVDEFSKYANKAIHKLSDYYGWKDGSKEKVVLHTLVGGITSELSGKSFTDGAYASGFNEIMINKIKNIAGTIRDKNGNTYINPTKMQNISMVLGFAINSLLEKDNKMGGYVSNLGSKWNGLDHVQQSCYANEPQPTIEQYLANNIDRGYKKGILAVIKSAYVMSVINGQIPEVAENDFIYSFNKAAEIVGINYRYVEDFGMTNNLNNFLWAVHNQDLINSRIIGYGSSAFAGALDYKSKTPIGTVISTIPDLVKDGDINKYGYEGAKHRSLIDYTYTGANIMIGALSKGAAYAVGTTIGGILSGEGINKVKDFVAPELPKEDSDERNREYEEKVKSEGFNGGIKD